MSGPFSNPSPSPFSNFTQLPSFLPAIGWRILRYLSIGFTLGLAGLLWHHPSMGLQVFWGLAIPALPLTFVLVPGVWRNICPLASSNQAPRRMGLSLGASKRSLPSTIAYPVGMALCLGLIVSRKIEFNASGHATAILILAAMGSAFVGGLFFKGKSGWCSSICPLLPVQRMYGQTPFVKVANTQCEPCVGCAKNCYDFNPGAAYLADQYDPNPSYRNFRRFFAGVFPGLILGFYLEPSVPEISVASLVGHMGLYMACSLTAFTMLDMVIGRTRNLAPVLFAVLSLNLYYWFGAPVIVKTLSGMGLTLDLSLVGAIRAAVVIASVVWVSRSRHVEKLFLRDQVKKSANGEIQLAPVVVETVRMNRDMMRRKSSSAVTSAKPAQSAAASVSPATEPAPRLAAPSTSDVARAPATDAASAPELHVACSGATTPLRKGQTLLSALEGCGAEIEAGCRAGACGADPIAVIDGHECLAPVSSDERATLERLGLASNTRLACMARVRQPGAVTVELKPHQRNAAEAAAATAAVPAAPAVPADPSVQRVVIVGNGVAGLTAAEHLRRNHPDCEIHLIGRENHGAYNRMAIAKLISGRSGMHGLHLLPEQWYAQQRITAWLATHVQGIDLEKQVVTLGTREALKWDRLILATGSSAWVPPLQGVDSPGSFVLRDADDAMNIRGYVQKTGARQAVVVGAGLLGLEAAQAMRDLGLAVTVLSRTMQILDRQIDTAASELLENHLAEQGIDVLCNAEAQSLRLDEQGRVEGMRLKDGRELPAQVLLVCAGTRPILDLARQAGLATAVGVKVDSRMRTSAEHVYAAGDVAEFNGESHGLWAVAREQAEVAAHNALGVPREYRGHVPVTALKVSGINVRSAGAAVASKPDETEAVKLGGANGRYCKLVLSGSRVIGAVMVGTIDEADEIIDAVREGSDVSSLPDVSAAADADLPGHADPAVAPAAMVVA